MRVLFAGTPDVAIPSLDAIIEAGHDVVGVLTRPPAPAGRGRRLVDSPVAVRATALGLPVFTPAHPREAEFRTRLDALAVDICPVVAYGALLPADLLAVPLHGWINLHFSILPRWRGAAPVQRSIIAGDPVVGATTFEITPPLDAGPIYLTHSEPLDPDATAGDVFCSLSRSGAALLAETLDRVGEGLRPVPQPGEGMTLASKLTTEQARIDWDRDARALHDHVRGHSPHPGAWTLWRDQRLKVLRTVVTDEVGLAPGTLAISKHRVLVGTRDAALWLIEVQPVGKKPMPGADWARGGVADGAVLG